MADSHHYETGTLLYDSVSGLAGGSSWDLIQKVMDFLGTTVGNGWSVVFYSGEGRTINDYEEWLVPDSVWSPGTLQYAEASDGIDEGVLVGNTPWSSNKYRTLTSSEAANELRRARTAYFKWTDGVADDSYFFLSTVSNVDGEYGASYDNWRTGVLQAPPETVFYSGSKTLPVTFFDGSFCTTPTDPPDPGYASYDCLTDPGGVTWTGMPWSYRDQPGYRFETKTSFYEAIEGSWDVSDVFTYYFFGGVENGVPYFYCVLESFEGFYSHFSFGKIPHVGDYKGGEFANGMWWPSISEASADVVTAPEHSRPFDSHWSHSLPETDYPHGINHLLVGDSGVTFDPGDSGTWLEVYLFGRDDDLPPYNHTCFGDCVGGLNTLFLSSTPNTFTGEIVLLKNYIRREFQDALGYWAVVGVAPAFRSVNIKYIQEGHEVIDDDGVTWKIFPLKYRHWKSAATIQSGDFGFAYRMP